MHNAISRTSVESIKRFTVNHTDGRARAGTLILPNGLVKTPAFMPVGTQASVKSLDPADLRSINADIVLANTYHLMLRPGGDLIERFGGIGAFMSWNGPILTDSGGFQVFSLAQQRTLQDDGVVFRSHIDGSTHRLRPEDAIRIQRQFGSDISMALDVCTGFEATTAEQTQAAELTHRWLPDNIKSFSRLVNRSKAIRPLLFGICQGGFDITQRRHSASILSSSEVDGLAIGGLSVGEPKAVLHEMLGASLEPLDPARPHYLMGVGSPEDLWNAVAAGVDMFDCVLPTRVARHGGLFTPEGRVNVKAARYRDVEDSIDPTCDCYACKNFSAGYLHHLFRSGELLSYRLASIHNLKFIMNQMARMRVAIQDREFETARGKFLSNYVAVDQQVRHAQQRRYRAASGTCR